MVKESCSFKANKRIKAGHTGCILCDSMVHQQGIEPVLFIAVIFIISSSLQYSIKSEDLIGK